MNVEKRALDVSYVVTELDPLTGAGGLGEASRGLTSALAGLGHTVTIWLPAYGSILGRAFPLAELKFARPLETVLAGRPEAFHLLEYETGTPGLRVVLVDHPASFLREGIYADPATGEDHPDNARRFILFQRAVLQGLKAMDLKPDVIHLNDYQTGLIATYLRTIFGGDPFYRGVATLFTIHNLGFQGIFPADILKTAGLSMDLYYPTGPLEFWGRVNFLKAGIVFSDVLTTLSRRGEVPAPTNGEPGFGLEGVLETRAGDLLSVGREGSWEKRAAHYDAAYRKAMARARIRLEG